MTPTTYAVPVTYAVQVTGTAGHRQVRRTWPCASRYEADGHYRHEVRSAQGLLAAGTQVDVMVCLLVDGLPDGIYLIPGGHWVARPTHSTHQTGALLTGPTSTLDIPED